MHLNLEGLIPLAGGAYVGLMAHGVIKGGKNPAKMERWRQKWGKAMKLIAPLLVLFGIAMLAGLFG